MDRSEPERQQRRYRLDSGLAEKQVGTAAAEGEGTDTSGAEAAPEGLVAREVEHRRRYRGGGLQRRYGKP